jgi:phenylalanyl-tRNA synthetase beta chain
VVAQGASHRPDVTREVDLIDEVARVRGFDKIPTRLPHVHPQPPRRTGELSRSVLAIAANLGLSEALTYAFVDPSALTRLSAPAPSVRLLNPLGEERSVMRTTLLPGLLDALGRARRHGELRVRLFCVGATFHAPIERTSDGPRPRLADDVGALPAERLGFAAILAGPRLQEMVLDPPDVDVYDAKAVALELVERISARKARVEFVGAGERTRHLHPRGAAEIYVEDQLVGRFGPLHPDVVRDFELGGPAQVVEIDLDVLEALPPVVPKYRAIPRLPPVTRDLSLVVAESVAAGRVAGVLAGAGGELCESIEVIAEFRGGTVPAGRRSLTFRVVYRDPKARADAEGARTLTDPEVDAVEARMIEAAKSELEAALRA